MTTDAPALTTTGQLEYRIRDINLADWGRK